MLFTATFFGLTDIFGILQYIVTGVII